MWSKQADMRNANMTSFKNKITNRKQKNSNKNNHQTAAVTNQLIDNNVDVETSAQQSSKKPAKHRGNNRNKHKDPSSASQKPSVAETAALKSGVSDDITADLESADVVLRSPPQTIPSEVVQENLKNNSHANRYSDSFVIDNKNGGGGGVAAELRTSSDCCFEEGKVKKQGRRFSDLFRHGTLKPTCSVENLAMNPSTAAKKEKERVSLERMNMEAKAKQYKKVCTRLEENSFKQKTATIPAAHTESSYLKRVKSKIYKSKSEDGILPSKTNVSKKSKNCERIPEDAAVGSKQQSENKKTLNFDFRLIRQTSNLEQIRTKTFGAFRSANNNNNNNNNNSEIGSKPLLAKAKSSSAINLNLLRTRRSRIIDQVRERSCKDVFDEFDFIAFGGGFRDKFGGSQRFSATTEFDPLPDIGENKPSQPVSRSGSDRRPDVVREEISKSCETSTSLDHGHERTDADTSASDHTTNFASPSNKKRASSNINRSESVKEQTEKRNKQRRNISDPSQHKTTSGDVELDQPGLSHTESGSSSSCSIPSCNDRLSESPCNSVEAPEGGGAAVEKSTEWESDADMEPGSWQKLFPEEELRNLQPHEKKRQDVINELFHTESTHVRNLRVLYEIFYKALVESQSLKQDELNLIFPNIKEMYFVHLHFSKEMKQKRREDPLVGNLGDMLVNMFGGCSGESLQKQAATFCERQQLALEFIKDKRRRDAKFDAVLTECEKRRQCRRLPLQGIVPTEMQRLSKYPLLLERLISSVEGNSSDPHAQEELAQLRRAHDLSKEILNYVNEAAKLALNRARLEDIQRRLDTTNFERSDHPISQEFKTLDLTRYKLMIEGNMLLRRPNKTSLPVHVLLLEEAVVILTKEGDRFLLKFFQSGSSAQPQPLSPIIKMSSLLVRINASSKNALFLVNTSTNNTQMYDLTAEDDIKRDVWFKHFSDASDAHNRREGKTKRPEPPPDSDESETVQDLPSTKDVAERAAETVVDAVAGSKENDSSANANNNDDEEEEQVFSDAQEAVNVETSVKENSLLGNSSEGGGGVHTKVTPDEWPLIQPSQVHVEVPPVHTAESRLTPLEQIRRKDEEVRRALDAKESLVADLLSIPREHFELIADMASQDTKSSKDLTERVLAAIYQVNQLNLAVNEALNVTEASAVSATGGKHPACHSQESLPGAAAAAAAASPPSVPAHLVKDIANSLTTQLTTLLSDVKQCEEERDMLRKELHRTRERLHEQESVHGTATTDEDSKSLLPTPEILPDLDSSKERPTESES